MPQIWKERRAPTCHGPHVFQEASRMGAPAQGPRHVAAVVPQRYALSETVQGPTLAPSGAVPSRPVSGLHFPVGLSQRVARCDLAPQIMRLEMALGRAALDSLCVRGAYTCAALWPPDWSNGILEPLSLGDRADET